jgi:tRNA-2-methylthio-N6-dimethylallyladenosine synthase
LSAFSKRNDVGKTFEVLAEGTSKRSSEHLYGRTSQNKVVVFPVMSVKKGEYVNVLVERSTSATLIGKIVY